MGEGQAESSRTMVLLGRTGNGKSSTGNTILGRNAFTAKFSLRSVTKDCNLQTTIHNGRELKVIDTPGLFDSDVDQAFVTKKIVKCIELAKDGLHGVLMVLSLKNRFTPEEAKVLDVLQIIFGPRIVNYMVIVFTGGDILEKEEITLEEHLEDSPKQLKDLLRRCNNRMVIFNNKVKKEAKKAQQVTELLKQIDSVVAENGGQPYSNELFQEFQEISMKLLNQEKHPTAQTTKEIAESTAQTIALVTQMVEDRLQKAISKLEEMLESEKSKRKVAEEKLARLEHQMATRPTKTGPICPIL